MPHALRPRRLAFLGVCTRGTGQSIFDYADFALSLFPDAPAHSNQVLRYWLDLRDPPAEAGDLAHRALYDAWTTAFLFERFLEDLTVAQMVKISANPALLPRLGFGKHAGIPLSEVPKDYLVWIVGQDFDEDVRFTAQHYLDLG